MQTDILVPQATRQQFATTRADTARVAGFAIGLGVFLLFLTGFAQTDALHNGAHNTRHALSFPCH